MLTICYQNDLIEAGCDEAGRGCLAGPLFAAAVILPAGFHHPLLNDSKQMSERNRDKLREVIIREAASWAVGEVSHHDIDHMNILNASFEAISRAATRLNIRPELLLVDGNRFRTTLDIPYKCVIGGDGLYANIAAASVLAKTFRDERMRILDMEFPEYKWAKNKGYATREHRIAVEKFGMSPYHRKTFIHNIGQLSLF